MGEDTTERRRPRVRDALIGALGILAAVGIALVVAAAGMAVIAWAMAEWATR